MWFSGADADGFNGTIGRVTLSGKISLFAVPTVPSRVNGITSGSDGNLWFTHDDNPSRNGKIGRITPTGKMRSEFPLPTSKGGPGPITDGSDGTIWFIETNSNKIGHLV